MGSLVLPSMQNDHSITAGFFVRLQCACRNWNLVGFTFLPFCFSLEASELVIAPKASGHFAGRKVRALKLRAALLWQGLNQQSPRLFPEEGEVSEVKECN